MILEIQEHIKSYRDKIEWVIAQAGRDFVHVNKNKPNLGFDLKTAESEALLLRDNDDLCYDRLTTPLSYSLWYQGKRLNAFIVYFSELLYNSRNENSIRIFDLGAGTGAVQFACSVVIQAMHEKGIRTPVVSIVNIDTSPLMLNYHNTYIRPLVDSAFPKGRIKCEYQVNSWHNSEHTSHSNNWIIASYLFDHSETISDVKLNFFKLVKKFNPNKLILITASRKRHFVQSLSSHLKDVYSTHTISDTGIFNGPLTQVQELRREISRKHNLNLNRFPMWKDPENWVYAEIFENKFPSIGFDFTDNDTIALFNPPFIVRRDIQLNKEQIDASEHSEFRPCLINGPAGCGKSLVISERIKNIILDYRKRGELNNLNILLTTFNIRLEDNIRSWIEELLNLFEIPFEKDGSKTIINGFTNDKGVINFLHFDILPTRLGRIEGRIKFDNYHTNFLRKIVDQATTMDVYSKYVGDLSMNPEFLLEEYERVWYGLEVENEFHYLEIQRKGRGHRPLGNTQRKIVAKILSHYEREIKKLDESSFIMRRREFLRLIKEKKIKDVFSHIIVDEFQDCTQADYSIFYGLLKNNNNLILAGDLAQSVHLGRSSDIPRMNNSDGERMGNRRTFTLKGSYRLPSRISECIKPISEYIISNINPDGSQMNSFKGAPPGARPILIYGDNVQEMAEKIISAVSIYEPYDIINLSKVPAEKITILEKDLELQQHLLSLRNNIAETDTVLKIKGLEKRCVVWSTRVTAGREDELYNFVYTILTRTSSILIIAIFPDLKNEVIQIIKKMNKSRLIFFDQVSKDKYENL